MYFRRHGTEEGAAEAKKRKKNKNALSSLSDIRPGDHAVHQNNGIGMYADIQRLEVQGATKHYLKTQYAGADVLYGAGDPARTYRAASIAPGDESKVKRAKLGRRRVEAHPGARSKKPPRTWPRSRSSSMPAAARPLATPSP